MWVLKSQIIKKNDSSRILILDAKVSDNDFLVIDLNNANNESEQLNTLWVLCYLLGNIYWLTVREDNTLRTLWYIFQFNRRRA